MRGVPRRSCLGFGLVRLRDGRERGLLFARGNHDAPYRLDPFAAVIDAGAGVDSAQYDVRIGLGLIGVLDQELGGEAEVLAAALVEAVGARVTIDGVVVGEFVFLADQVGVAPTEEGLFYVGTVGVVADGAFAGMAFDRGKI